MKTIRAHALLLVAFFPLMLWGQPVARFSAPVLSGCSPHQVQFSNTSEGSSLQYFWDFGNGNTSVVKDPYVQYNTPGSYTVTLVVTDESGKKDTARRTNYIVVHKAAPTLHIVAQDTALCTGGEAVFSLANTDEELAGYKISWDFGEGIVREGKTVAYKYSKNGVFTLQVLAENANGCIGAATKENYLNVSPKPVVTGVSPSYFHCRAPYFFSVPTVSLSKGNGPYTYRWDYGDGSTSFGAQPSHQYFFDGTYKVRLTVTDGNQCPHVYNDITTVTIGRPKPAFEVYNPSPCTGGGHSFVNKTQAVPGWPATYEWSFGDGKKAIGPSVHHTYSSSGTYRVVLKVIINGQCIDSAEMTREFSTVLLGSSPMPLSQSNVKSCTAPYTTTLFSTVSPKSTVTWFFGDGDTMQGHTVQHTYKDTGTYDINIKVTDSTGCTTWSFYPKHIIIKQPEAKAALSASAGCKPLAVRFTDQSTAADGIESWHWDFGDGNTSDKQNPAHVYQDTGVFRPRLTITTQSGCEEQINLLPVSVGIPVPPGFTFSPNSGCLSELRNVVLTNLTDVSAAHPQRYEWIVGKKIFHVGESGIVPVRERPGTYNVGLVAVHNGCRDTLVKPQALTIKGPYADFAVVSENCRPNLVTIEDKSVGNHVYYMVNDQKINSRSFQWKFPWKSVNNILQVAYDDKTGCWDSVLVRHVVPDTFYAAAAVSQPVVCRNGNLTFTATASHPAVFHWKLSNGTTFQGESVAVNVSQPGWHNIELTAVNSDGCSATVSMEKAFFVHGPVLTVTNSALRGCVPFTVEFNGSISSEYPLEKAFWVYNGKDTLPYNGPKQKFTITDVPADQNKGIFVSLVAVDTAGCHVSFSQRINPTWPKPEIQATPQFACRAINYKLEAPVDAHHVYGNAVLKWRIDGKEAGQGKSIVVPFTQPGQHLVTLTMTDANGCTDSASRTIAVDTILEPKANFAVSPSEGKCPPFLATFTSNVALGYAPVSKYEWDFGDGTTSTAPNPEKIYTRPGNFRVRLRITDALGCVDSIAVPNSVVVYGPYGEMALENSKGCNPLTVTLKADVHRTVRVLWDLGNGIMDSGFTVTHTYAAPGTYTPSMILFDTGGCAFSVPSPDKIIVADPAYPAAAASGFCFGSPTRFAVDEASAADPTLQFAWQLGNGAIRTQPSFDYTYPQAGTYTVRLRTTRLGVCHTDASFTIKVGGLVAEATSSATRICMGDKVKLQFTGTSDTTVTSYHWVLGDGNTATGNPYTAPYPTPGIYSPKLVVANAMGCMDTFALPSITVGDMSLPEAVPLVRVSVESHSSISVTWERTKRYDFSKYRIYRAVEGQPLALVKEIAQEESTQWIDETGIKPADHAYTYAITQTTLCGNETPAALWQPHTSIHIAAKGQVNSVALGWTPYKGWASVSGYTIYRQESGENANPAVATVPADVNAWIDSNIRCGESYRYTVVAQQDEGSLQSWSTHADATPIYVPMVPKGQLRLVTVTEENHVLVLLQPAPEHKRPAYYLLERSTDGQHYQQVAQLPANSPLQYLDEIATPHLASMHYRLRVQDSCGDIGLPGFVSSTIFLQADTTPEALPRLHWTPYTHWQEGVSRYNVESSQEGQPLTPLAELHGHQTSTVDNATDLNNASKYCYRVYATSAEGTGLVSYSNVACLAPEGSLYVPNAFTPDDNYLNEEFKAAGRYINQFQMRIYNRWGEEVFAANDINQGWDGTFRGKPAAEGQYTYVIVAKGSNMRNIYRKGSLLLVR